MKRYLFGLVIGLCGFLVQAPALAAGERGTADEAIALVKKGLAHIKSNGVESAYAAFNDPKGAFVDRDLYLFVFDMSGKTLAHGANAKLLGKNLIDMKDIDGKPLIKDFLELANAKGKGWVDYKWPHPVTKEYLPKSSYIEKIDKDTIIGCGIYK